MEQTEICFAANDFGTRQKEIDARVAKLSADEQKMYRWLMFGTIYTNKEWAEELKVGERQVRQYAHNLRENGIGVISTGAGYKIARTTEEIAEAKAYYQKQLRAAAWNIHLVTGEPLEEILNYNLFGQLKALLPKEKEEDGK